jgi:hypothetical protein
VDRGKLPAEMKELAEVIVDRRNPRCSKSFRQPRIVSSSNSKATATSRQLHPAAKRTRALIRRVTRDAVDPSRASAISSLRSPFAKEAASNHKAIGIRQTKKSKEFFLILQ